MANISHELKEKIKMAHSAEEVAALLRPSGVDETLATQIWNELSGHRDDKELSLDELETISGGADRDWAKDGCAATYEYDSWCDSNDWCYFFDVTYDHPLTNAICPVCGTNLYVDWTDYATNPSDDVTHCRCKKCGYTKAH